MTLDQLSPPQAVRFDSREFCDRCGDVVPVLVAGLCRYCTDQTRNQVTKEDDMDGTAGHHVSGGDRTVPFHVPYSAPRPKPTGLNWSALQPEPGVLATADPSIRQEIPVSTTTEDADALPAYAQQLAELLVATEGHADPLVRAVRKIVTQSAVALHQAYTASQNSDPDAKTTAARAISSAAPSSVPAPSVSEPTTERKTRAPSAAVQLMRSRGIEASQVRAWAQEQGIEVSSRGSIHIDVVTAYADAHPAAA